MKQHEQLRRMIATTIICLKYQTPLDSICANVYCVFSIENSLDASFRKEVFVRLGAEYAFDILHTFPFSSETKRMGIIVSVVATGKKFFILKGADNVSSHLSLG